MPRYDPNVSNSNLTPIVYEDEATFAGVNGTLAVTTAAITAPNNATTQLIAANTGKIIKIVSLVVICNNAITTVTFRGTSTAISAAFPFAAYGGMVLPFNPAGWITSPVSEPIRVEVDPAGAATAVHARYIEVG